MVVTCDDGSQIEILELQPPGKKVQNMAYIRQSRLDSGLDLEQLAREQGTCKTAMARFWRWLLGKSP